MTRRATAAVALAILAAGLLVRLPGCGWGITPERVHEFHPDEDRVLATTLDALAGRSLRDPYPPGFALQVAGLLRITGRADADYRTVVGAGRGLNVAYGLLTIGLVAWFGRRLGLRPAAILAAMVIQAGSGLAIIYSHYATADTGLACLLLATCLASYSTWRDGTVWTWWLAVGLAGMALAFKMAWVALVPPAVATFRLRRGRWLARVLLVPVCLLVFEAAAGWQYTPGHWAGLWGYARRDNLLSPEAHNRWLNPLIYGAALVAGLGLPATALVLLGLREARRRYRSADHAVFWRSQQGLFLVWGLPVAAAFLTACGLSVPFARHVLPVLPLLALVGGIGWASLSAGWSQRRRVLVVALLLGYQGVYAVSVTRPYWSGQDTRERLAGWLQAHVVPGTRAYVDNHARKFDWDPPLVRDPDRPIYRQDRLLLYEYYYRRYLRSPFNPLTSRPDERHVYHARNNELTFVQALFHGETDYERVQVERVRYATPELIAYKALWGSYPDFAGDVVWFERNTNRVDRWGWNAPDALQVTVTDKQGGADGYGGEGAPVRYWEGKGFKTPICLSYGGGWDLAAGRHAVVLEYRAATPRKVYKHTWGELRLMDATGARCLAAVPIPPVAAARGAVQTLRAELTLAAPETVTVQIIGGDAELWLRRLRLERDLPRAE